MKSRRIISVLLLLVLLFSLSACNKYDTMIGEGSFEDVVKSIEWFFKVLTPSIFGAIDGAWHLDSVIGFIMALLMTVVLFLVYVFLTVMFFAIVVVLVLGAFILTIIGYIIFLLALLVDWLFHIM